MALRRGKPAIHLKELCVCNFCGAVQTILVVGAMNLERLKNVDWKGKLGKGLLVTAHVAEFLADVPGAGIIKAAATLGAELLDPPVSLDEIKELQEELQDLQKDSSRRVDRSIFLLRQEIAELEKKYNNPTSEVRKDFHNIKAEIWEAMTSIQKDNNACLSQLSDMTQLIKQVFSMVTQLNYKVSLKII